MDPNAPGMGAPPKMRQASVSQQQQQAGPKRYDGHNGNPSYEIGNGGHYGASAQIALAGHAPPTEVFQGPWANVNQGLTGQYRDILNTYWQNQVTRLETDDHDYKIHQLPLARIKKVMKADPEVKMISAEAPILFAKGCDIFITELTMRAWIHAEENKRRTLQRSDIASALTKSDMFDFLIDIVPREEAAGHKRTSGGTAAAQAQAAGMGAVQQQTGVHPPPQGHMGPPEYGIPQQQHLPEDYRQPVGMNPYQQAPGDPTAYGPPGPGGQMFDPSQGMGQSMYGAYGQMPQQQQ